MLLMSATEFDGCDKDLELQSFASQDSAELKGRRSTWLMMTWRSDLPRHVLCTMYRGANCARQLPQDRAPKHALKLGP